MLENIDVFIKIIPDVYDILSGTVKMNSILGTPLIEINHKLQTPSELLVKNTIDIVLSFVIIIVFSPIYLICAILVKLSSEGPIIYKQKRLGQYGKEFNIYKFRSMYTDAEKHGPQLSSKTDSRVTGWGRIMRKIRLDETPQFFNVLLGDMSFVGPRPALTNQQDLIALRTEKGVHNLVPGVTGWAQVNGRDALLVIQKVELDAEYIRRRSLFFDLRILWLTLLKIISKEGVSH